MDIAQLCSDLVRIRSENPPGDTSKVIRYIANIIHDYGIRPVITENEEGRCNLLTEPVPTGLLLCGHVDVVPARDEGWSTPPFSGLIKEGSVWGRGATDMKGGCAALLAAFCRFVDSYGHAPAQLAFVCDEETGGENGIRHLLSTGMITPCDCLIAEPTPVRNPTVGQKGLVRLEMQFTGSPAHGSLYPVAGRSAIVEAMDLIDYMRTLSNQTYAYDDAMNGIILRSSEVLAESFSLPQASEILTGIMFNPGVISGGEKTNIVAQSCSLDLEMRIPWGCNIRDLIQDLMIHAPHAVILSSEINEPSMTSPDARIVTRTCDAIMKVAGGQAAPIVQWAASDARHLRAAGFQVAEYGPGELKTLHAIDEHITIESLERSSRVYESVMAEYAR